MRYRDNKIFAQDNYYHVYNRGNGKQDIFLDDADYKFFLYRLKENLFPEQKRTALLQEGRPLGGRGYVRKALPSDAFDLICYCLMPNHFHFLIRQNTQLPVSKIISKVCTGYSMYFNKKYERVGGLLQSKFKAVLVDSDPYLLWLSAYIHQNPKVAGLVKNLEDYPYSSFLDYIGKRQGMLCHTKTILDNFKNSEEYEKFVDNSFEKIKERKDLKLLLLDS